MKIPRRILKKVALKVSVYFTVLAMLVNIGSPALYSVALAVENEETQEVTEAEEPEEKSSSTEALGGEEEVADLTEYEEVLESVDEEDYTADSWETYQEVVENNKVTEEDSQEDVDGATENIEAAQDDLANATDLTEYEEALESVDKKDYTVDSWETYQEVVEENKVTKEDSQEDVDKATENIKVAQDDLVKKSTNKDVGNEEATEDDDGTKSEPEEEDQDDETKEASWEQDGDKATIGPVQENKTYKAPQNEKVTVTFTKLPENPGNLTIEEITLTDEQVEKFGALSNKAYDITSNMENGTFEYDLTLPKPKNKEKVEVKFAKNVDELDNSELVPEQDIKAEDEEVGVKLNHMTVFYVSKASEVKLVINEFDYDQPSTDDAEFIELKNISDESVQLSGYGLKLLNGNNNGEVYGAIDLEDVSLVSGEYYVVCGDENKVLNCDLSINNFSIQNGAEDAIALYKESAEGDILIDSVSYEGSLEGYVETEGFVGEYDSILGSSRYPDGNDTDDNSEDFVLSCITPGEENVDTENCGSDVVYVDDSNDTGIEDGTKKHPFNTIQEGIDDAIDGDVIYVVEGTYEEVGQIVIDKNLTIIGEGKDDVFIKPNHDTASSLYQETSGWFYVKAEVRFSLEGVTLDGNGRIINTAVQSRGEVDIENCLIKNIYAYKHMGLGIQLLSGRDNQITNCEFENIERIGIHVRGNKGGDTEPFAVIDGCTYTGRGEGEYLEYGIEFGGGGSGSVDNFTVSNILGDTDWSSSGILATTLYGPGTVATVTNSHFLNNNIGIIVGYNDDDVLELTATGNVFDINSEQGIRAKKNVTVNAEENWWGSADFSDVVDGISGEVDFNPWCLNEDCTETSEDVYPESDTEEIGEEESGDVVVDGLTVKNPVTNPGSGEGEIFVAKYGEGEEPGGLSTGVDGFYYDIQYSGDLKFPIDIEIEYSDDSTADNYLDETKFVSLYYYDGSDWKDYRNDNPASTVSIDTGANVISASLQHLTPIVPVIDITPPEATNEIKIYKGHNSDSENEIGVDGYTNNPEIRIEWEAVADAEYYWLGTQFNDHHKKVYATHYDANMSPGHNPYYYKISAVDDVGNEGAVVTSYKINLDTEAPEAPTLLSPADGDIVNGNPTQSWSSVSDADHYYYESYLDSSGNNPVYNANISGTSRIVGGMQTITFYWRVKAVDEAGNESGWSEMRELNIDNDAPIITFDQPVSDLVYNKTVHLKATCNEDCDYVNFWWRKDGESFSSSSKRYHYVNDNGTNFEWDLDTLGAEKADGTNYTMDDGVYYLYAAGKDLAGNWARTAGEVKIVVDNTPPSIPSIDFTAGGMDVLNDGFTNSENFTFNLSSDDAIRYQLKYWNSIPGDTYNGEKNAWNPKNKTSSYSDHFSRGEGMHHFRFSACDLAGNCSAYSDVFNVTYDNTAPVLASKTEFSGWYGSSQTSVFEYTDDNMLGDYSDPSCDITTEGANQTCDITPNVCDEAGNCNTDTVTSNEVNLDFTNPESVIDGGDDNGIVYSNDWDGSISGTASDELSGVAGVKVSIQRGSDNKYWDGSGWVDTEFLVDTEGAETWSYQMSSAPGADSYTIQSHAVDNADNMEETYSLTIVLDKTIPEVDLAIDSANPDGNNDWYVSNPEIALTASDDVALEKIEYQLDSKTGAWFTYTNPVKIEDGKSVFYYRSWDKAGNESAVGVKNVKVDTQDPDEVRGVDAEYNSEENEVKLSWDAEDSDIYKVYIYRGGSRNFKADSTSKIDENDDNDETYSDDGFNLGEKYYYKLIARDEAGNVSDTKVISVVIPEEEGGLAVVTDEGTEPTEEAVAVEGEETEEGEESDETIVDDGAQAKETEGDTEVLGDQDDNDGSFFSGVVFWVKGFFKAIFGWFLN